MSRDLVANGRGWSQLRKRPGGDRGAALVELAVALPLIVLILVGAADFARVFYYAIELTNAARAATQWAAYDVIRTNDDVGITAAAQSAAPNISPVAVSLHTPEPPVCRCATDDGSTFSGIVACNSTCTSPQHLIQTITVTVSKTFTLISRWPGFPRTMNLTRAATTRVPF